MRGLAYDVERSLKGVIPRRLRPAAKRLYVRALPASTRRAQLANRLRAQGYWCRVLGSPLYGDLLERAAADVEVEGPCWDVLEGRPPTDLGADDALPLRFTGSLHRLVLEGRAPALARHYPSAGGEPDPERVWSDFRDTVGDHRGELREMLGRPVQTNEVSRCPALVGGFLLAASNGHPIRLLEVGASAGLNLRWDRYRYEAGATTWGDPGSPVRFADPFAGGRLPPFDVDVEVAERRGCDTSPLDPTSAAGRLSLESFVWPDQTARMKLLRGALEVAELTPLAVERADAPGWIDARLREPTGRVLTVVFHSFVMQYLDQDGRDRFGAVLREAGARATDDAPLAWLRMEWGAGQADVHLTTWPGATTELLATADNQGRAVRWLAGAPGHRPARTG